MAYEQLWSQQHAGLWFFSLSSLNPGIYVWDMWSQKGHTLNNQVFFEVYHGISRVSFAKSHPSPNRFPPAQTQWQPKASATLGKRPPWKWSISTSGLTEVFCCGKKIAPGKLGFAYPFLLVLGGWLTNLFEKYAQVKLDHRNPGLDGELPPSDAWKKIPKNTPDNGSRITYANPKSLLKMMLVRTSHLVLGNKIISYLPNGGELMNPTWRIIPFSKWLVTPIYKAFRPFGRGRNPLRGLTNHGY